MRQGFWGCVVAAGLMVAAGSAWAASDAPENAGQNVKESQQYEQLLCSNPHFKETRIAKECGPLKGSQFYDNCVASFQCGAVHRHSNRPPPSETISR